MKLILLDYFVFIVCMIGIVGSAHHYNLDHKISWLIAVAMLTIYGVNHVFKIRKRNKLERLIGMIK